MRRLGNGLAVDASVSPSSRKRGKTPLNYCLNELNKFWVFSFKINHIVLGKGPAGGSWHRMDPNLRTLSLAAWMSLPGLDFKTWEAKKWSHQNGHTEVEPTKTSSTQPSQVHRRNLSLKGNSDGDTNQKKEIQTRALISSVAEYYESYVKEMRLEKNFWNDVVVTNVVPIRVNHKCFKNYRWLVTG